MNKILNNKINSDLTCIISSYLLPSIRKLNLNNLLNSTYSIYTSLRENHCYNNSYTVFYDNLKNSRIIKDPKYKYWTIRKEN